MIVLGNSKTFENYCHFSSYLGLVLKKHNNGRKVRLMGITKHEDPHLRGILIHSARSVTYSLRKLSDEQCKELQCDLKDMIARTIALENKIDDINV
ncbi:transposase [Xenorhabdus sp. PB62.4]|nr:transposase [Xenorhabdus sp. PB62.4]